jgi:hypothetical protein
MYEGMVRIWVLRCRVSIEVIGRWTERNGSTKTDNLLPSSFGRPRC